MPPLTSGRAIATSGGDRAELLLRLSAVEQRIALVQLQLPAHSIKPTQMSILLELEDERDEIQQQLASMEQ